MTINRRLPVVSGGGEVDLGPIESDIATLETTVGGHTTDIAGLADDFESAGFRLDTFDGISNIGPVGSTLTVTPGLGNGGIKLITLTTNLTISFNNGLSGKLNSLELVITQDATGGRLITWNETVKWPAGSAPVLSTAPGAIDRIIFTSYDNGSTWYGDLIGKGYA